MVGIIIKCDELPNIFYELENHIKDDSSKDDIQEKINEWNVFSVPFVFAITELPENNYGVEVYNNIEKQRYHGELKDFSGICFFDLRKPYSFKNLYGLLSPAGLHELLTQSREMKEWELQYIPSNFLFSKDSLALTPCQGEAVEATVQADIDNKQFICINMDRKTDQTRTVLGIIYRFLRAKRFCRILLLVDGAFFEEQSQEVFKEVTLAEICSLKHINIKQSVLMADPVLKTTIQIATAYSLARRTLYSPDLPVCVSDYDLIIDYNLFSSEQAVSMEDFWAVLEYYHAVKILFNESYLLRYNLAECFGKDLVEIDIPSQKINPPDYGFLF